MNISTNKKIKMSHYKKETKVLKKGRKKIRNQNKKILLLFQECLLERHLGNLGNLSVVINFLMARANFSGLRASNLLNVLAMPLLFIMAALRGWSPKIGTRSDGTPRAAICKKAHIHS